ncbi:type IV toxin-antitoxin system AbiEi family antitoxin domain-containing protein [Nesterenkonia sp. HG001]|uniref:type IV toxin-antitoxin system AbiEi family antitoxin domain-containing protein n=1 Tax=Nesterenkonia sp. HG001 TaxID=2983207 RepID=UPI002AC3913B|nr:type IV toxin-antitoxin system AbiEi family antitoxin domain-containing protein [Nesterenkonia sp. HG001]MDZ5078287.1 hypothetical protein [Nesterenkonia sp. HG001]
MRRPSPLPTELLEGVFSRRRALELGVSPRRLRAGDITRVGHGLYRCTAQPVFSPSTQHARFMSTLRALHHEYPGFWFSHATAAALYGLDLPSWLDGSSPIHLSRAESSTTTHRLPGLRSHAVVVEDGEVTEHLGLPVSRPARVYFDLMRDLPLKELVALGDQLVRHPRPALEGRDDPWETPSSLAELVGAHRKTKGIVKGRAALELIRIGADSRPESFLRLALLDSGLPEPELQVRPRPGSPWSGDLGYSELKIVIQYDGSGHFSAAEQAKDQRRDRAFEQDGWRIIHANAEDLRDGFRRIVARVAHALTLPPEPLSEYSHLREF